MMIYWILWEGRNERPERYVWDNFEQMWHDIRELTMRRGQIIAWIIRE